MKGDWLAAFARAVTTEDGFQRIVAPAIADLQHESIGPGMRALRAYAAVWMTLIRAVAQDFSTEATAGLDRQTMVRMLKTCSLAAVILVIPRVWYAFDGSGPQWKAIAIAASLPRTMVLLLPVAMLPLAALLAGRRRGRAVLLACAAFGTLASALSTFALPHLDRLQNELLLAAVVRDGLSENDQALSLQEVRRHHAAEIAAMREFQHGLYEDRRADRAPVSRAFEISLTAAAFAFALCGRAMRTRRDWLLVVLTAGIFLGYVRVNGFATVWMSGLGFDPVFRGWLPTLTVFAFGAAALMTRAALDRRWRSSTVQP